MNKKTTLLSTFLLALVLLTLTMTTFNGNLQAAPQAATDQREAAAAAAHWLVANHQNDDGGYTAFSTGANAAASNVAGTLDAALALASAGYDLNTPFFGKTAAPGQWLAMHGDDVAAFAGTSGGAAGKAILGLAAANLDVRDVGSYNFVISLTNQLSVTGQYNTNTAFNQSLAILALTTAGEAVPITATQWLLGQQAATGSWDDGFGTTDNADATAMSIMALLSAGISHTHTDIIRARDFLSNTQTTAGGFEYGTGFGQNGNSTALVVQALSALGEDFYSEGGAWHKDSGQTPLAALMSYQSGSGAFQTDFGSGPFDDFFSTIQGLSAVTGRPLPYPYRRHQAMEAAACLATLQDDVTGGWEQFAGFGINAGGTARAIEGIAAAGMNPNSATFTTGGSKWPIEALADLTPAYLTGGRGGRVGVVMQGVAAGGGDVTNFAGYNLPISVTSYLLPTGEYAETNFGILAHAEAMRGLQQAGLEPDSSAVNFLLNSHTNGDWGSADDNGIALQVLGQDYPVSTLAVLSNTQLADGGWGNLGVPSNPNSISEVVQGLATIGQHPFSPAWSVVVAGRLVNTADTVTSQQLTSGCLPAFGGGDGPFATTDAILLLMAQPADPIVVATVYLPIIFKE